MLQFSLDDGGYIFHTTRIYHRGIKLDSRITADSNIEASIIRESYIRTKSNVWKEIIF